MWVSAGFTTETLQATFLADPGLHKQTGNMTWAPINFLKILNDSKDLIKCFTAEAAASNYGFGICEVASWSPALRLKMQAVIIALSEHKTLLLPSYTLLCELVCPSPSMLSAEALIKVQNTLNIEINSCRWSCKALWKCNLEDHDLAQIVRGQLQALKATLLLGVGHARKVWDLPSCERVPTAVPCSGDPIHWGTNTTSACRWGHISWSRVRRGERERGVAAPTDTPPDSRGATGSHWSFRSSWLWEKHSE